MSKDETNDESAAREKFENWLQELEAAAAELVEVGDASFKGGEPAACSAVAVQPFNRINLAIEVDSTELGDPAVKTATCAFRQLRGGCRTLQFVVHLG
jgi:hypothetical protein